VALFRARHGRGTTGPVAAAACFALLSVCAAVYFTAFGFAGYLPAALAPAMGAMVHYNSYVDLLLHLVLGFAMVLLLMEDVRQEMERGRGDAERAEQQARIVAEVSELFSASLDHEATLRTVARLVLPRMADSCIVYLLDTAGAVRRLEAAHVDPEREARLREYLHRHPLRPGSIFAPVARVLRTGAPELVPALPPQEAVAEGDEPGDAVLYPRSLIVAPLRVHGETLGAISYGLDGSEREYGPDDLVTAGEIARRAALAIDNARLYGETRQAVHAREQVLQIVSHDLRNPLGVIMLNTGIAMEAVDRADGDTRAALEGVVMAAGQMNRLIENLVDLARMDAGHMSLERQPHPAASLVRAAVAMLRPLADTRAQRLEHEVPDGLPPVWLEADRLLQVLSNLVGNAIKFTPEGGRIVVSAARGDGEVRFSVADTGPGIQDEHQPFLFDRFWQADRSRRGGTGLGLAIAKGIVEAHGGRIWVESRLREGSTFHFTVPVFVETEG
jgi:signal transduction histidine kinase